MSNLTKRDQVLVGEKIKGVFRKKFSKKSFNCTYYELNAGEIVLIIIWSRQTFADQSKKLIWKSFSINEEDADNGKGKDVVYINLQKISDASFAKVKEYFEKELPLEEVLDSTLDKILKKIDSTSSFHGDVIPDKKTSSTISKRAASAAILYPKNRKGLISPRDMYAHM